MTTRETKLPPWIGGIHGVVPLLVLGLVVSLRGQSTSTYGALFREDAWGEWATFFAFLAAGIVWIAVGLRSRGWGRFFFWGLGVFCFFVAGEEISWGHRLFAFRPPDLFLEKNYQQEANLHNLLKDIFDTRWMVLIVALAYGVLLPLVALASRPLRRVAPSWWMAPAFAAVALLEWDYPFKLAGELAELILGLAFLGDSALRIAPGATLTVSWLSRCTPALSLLALSAGAWAPPGIEAFLYRNADDLVPQAQTQLNELHTRLADPSMLREKLFRKRRVHKRLYTTIEAGYTNLPSDEFYLDPWNQPYWLLYQRTEAAAGWILLYTFGPDRRRSSDFDLLRDGSVPPEEALQGDDLGILFRARGVER